MIRCVIADDEPLSRWGVEQQINKFTDLEIVAQCANGLEVMNVIANESVDLLFLDIEMPNVTGIDLLKTVRKLPPVILITAYEEFAIESYEYNVIDYLIKPFSSDRFYKAVDKARDYLSLKNQPNTDTREIQEYCFVRSGKVYEKIIFSSVLFVEALQNYVVIHTDTQRYIVYLTLKNIEEQFPVRAFIRISKSHVVNIQRIEQYDGTSVVINGNTLTIGRSYREDVERLLLGNNLLRRS